ncbi:hypothetical protein R6Q59_019127 [Mikania micrantha]
MIHRNTPADLGESEPPHIKNWFSSYEYESFVLETNDNFGFSDDQGSQGYENECSTGSTLKSTHKLRELVTNGKNESLLIECNKPEEENNCQNQAIESQDSPLLSPEPPGIENWFSSYVYESPEVDTIDDLFLSDLKETTVDSNEKIKEFEQDGNSCVTPDDLIYKQAPKCDNNLTKDDKKPTELPNSNASVSSSENESKNLEESRNGFVSIKNKKENYEKLKEAKVVDQKRCVVSSVNKMNKKSVQRVILGDVTNILQEHSSVTGKWKCPRKMKPDVGPPLKQLRLGQWFHHV